MMRHANSVGKFMRICSIFLSVNVIVALIICSVAFKDFNYFSTVMYDIALAYIILGATSFLLNGSSKGLSSIEQQVNTSPEYLQSLRNKKPDYTIIVAAVVISFVTAATAGIISILI